MSTKREEPMTRTHVWLFAHDIERLDAMMPNRRVRSKFIRTFVRKYLNALEAQAQEIIDKKRLQPIVITMDPNEGADA